jgi:hypothetical protein
MMHSASKCIPAITSPKDIFELLEKEKSHINLNQESTEEGLKDYFLFAQKVYSHPLLWTGALS